MIKILKRFIPLLALFSLFISCKYDFSLIPRKDTIEKRSPTFTKLTDSTEAKRPQDIGDKFCVLLLGDTHFGRNGWFKPKRNAKPFYDKLDSLLSEYDSNGFPIAFGINVGDVSDTGKQADFDQNKEFEEEIAKIAKTYNDKYNENLYWVVGNHDLYNDGWDVWKRNSYQKTSTYYFETNGSGSSVSWYFLDSGSGMLGNNQLKQIAQITSADTNEKVILSHYPINAQNINYYNLTNPLEIAKLTKLFIDDRVKLSLEGHFHPGGEKDILDKNNTIVCHEEVLPGFVDHTGFGILTVDLTNSTPDLKLKIYYY